MSPQCIRSTAQQNGRHDNPANHCKQICPEVEAAPKIPQIGPRNAAKSERQGPGSVIALALVATQEERMSICTLLFYFDLMKYSSKLSLGVDAVPCIGEECSDIVGHLCGTTCVCVLEAYATGHRPFLGCLLGISLASRVHSLTDQTRTLLFESWDSNHV